MHVPKKEPIIHRDVNGKETIIGYGWYWRGKLRTIYFDKPIEKV